MATTPLVSVIVPVYNDPSGVADTLQCLCEQTYPIEEYEVLPVDNGSTDRTRETIDRIATATDATIRPLEETDRQGSFAARNTGIQNARGDFLFFLDADMLVPETWIADGVARMDDTGALYAGCNIEFTATDTSTAAGRYDSRFGFPARKYVEDEHFALTGGLLTRRELFDRVGLFDERLVSSGDREFGNRVHEAGIEQHFFGDITIEHPPRTSMRSLLKKHVRIGRGQAQLEAYHDREFERGLTDPLLYAPKTWPWNVRQWARNEFPDGSADEWSTVEVGVLFATDYVVDLAHAVGRAAESLKPPPVTERSQPGGVYKT